MQDNESSSSPPSNKQSLSPPIQSPEMVAASLPSVLESVPPPSPGLSSSPSPSKKIGKSPSSSTKKRGPGRPPKQNKTTSSPSLSPPKKRGRPPKSAGKKSLPKNDNTQTKVQHENGNKSHLTLSNIDTNDDKNTSENESKNLDEQIETTTTAAAAAATTMAKRNRIPTIRLLEHWSADAATPTNTKKKKRRGRPPGSKSKKKEVFTFKDAMPMETSSIEGAMSSSGHSSYEDYENVCEGEDEEDEDEIICCLCHCAVDYTDEEMFEPLDGGCNDGNNGAVGNNKNENNTKSANREERDDSYVHDNEQEDELDAEQKKISVEIENTEKPPLLPRHLYDPQNAILLCDTPGCNRAYHQRCHFVPVFVIPRGDWHCLVCRYGQYLRSTKQSYYSPSTGSSGKRRGRPPKVQSPQFQPPPVPLSLCETAQGQSKSQNKAIDSKSYDIQMNTELGTYNFQQSDLIRLYRSKLYQVELHEMKEMEEEEAEKSLLSFIAEKEEKDVKVVDTISLSQQQQLPLTSDTTAASAATKMDEAASVGENAKDITTNKEVVGSKNSTEDPKIAASLDAQGITSSVSNIKDLVSPAIAAPGTISCKCVGGKSTSNEAAKSTNNEALSQESTPSRNQRASQMPSFNNSRFHGHGHEIPQNSSTPATPQKTLIPVAHLHKEFEYSTSSVKSSLLHKELTIRIKSTINHSLAHIRRSQDTLRAYTETERSRKSLLDTYEKTQRLPQQIVQSLLSMAKGKLKIRETLESLDKFIKGFDDVGMLMSLLNKDEGKVELKTHTKKDKTSIAKKFPSWFSNDVESHRRIEPRIGSHTKEHADSDGISSAHPNIININAEKTKSDQQPSRNDSSDDDDLIETDNIACAVCFSGTCTDSNDLLLCDGEGCNRSFHMNCVTPRVTQQEIEHDDDSWFCPYCTNLAVLVHYAQVEYLGDEWEERLRRKEQYKRHHHGIEELDNDDNESTSSWERAADVFPEAEYENAVAVKWRDGLRDEETDELLSSFLGCSFAESNTKNGEDRESTGMLIDDEDDEEDDDEDYNEEEEKEVGSGNEDSSDGRGSEDDDTSLEDLSSIESGVDKSELDALSSCSSSDSEEDDDEKDDATAKKQKTRRSKRQRQRNNLSTREVKVSSSSKQERDRSTTDVGTLDEANIIVGKRNRTKVDYRRLNDAMFGDVSATEAALLFGEEDDYYFNEHGDMDESDKKKHGKPRKKSLPAEEEKGAARRRKRGRPRKENTTPKETITSKKLKRPPKKLLPDQIVLVGSKSPPESPGKKRRGRPPKKKDVPAAAVTITSTKTS